MLDPQSQDAIFAAVRQACDVFRSVIREPSDGKDFALVMLLLKYISDIHQDRVITNDEQSDDQHFVVPEGCSFDDLYAARYQSGNGQRIDQAIHAIEKANVRLQGAFQGISFDATSLGSLEQKDRILCQLLEAIKTDALNFRARNKSVAKAAAYACDSLIRYVAEISGKRGGNYFTPPEISQLIAHLMQARSGETIGDPCCGSGSLLIACSQFARKQSPHEEGCALYGQEADGHTWALAKMNMILHGESRHELKWGDTLRTPKLLEANGNLRKFEIVVCNPPFSVQNWGHENAPHDSHQRYRRGIPPRAMGDYAFISHMVETLHPKNGRMAVVVPLGVLFRGASEGQIRKQFIKENLIDAVIALPAKILPSTGIPLAILVIRKNKTDDGVLFIDASRSYQHGKIQNILRQADLEQIENTYNERCDANQYARLVNRSEIVANDYNLSVARYVDTTEVETETDLTALRAERVQLKAELAHLEIKLATLMGEINHG